MLSDLQIGDKIYTVARLTKEKIYATVVGETKTQWRCEYDNGGTFNITKNTGMKVGTGSMFSATFWWKGKNGNIK